MAAQLPRWVDADTIEVPATARTEPGVGAGEAAGAIGDGALEVTSGDPAFGEWAEWLAETGHPRPKAAAPEVA